jgi:hypothetical protein
VDDVLRIRMLDLVLIAQPDAIYRNGCKMFRNKISMFFVKKTLNI